ADHAVDRHAEQLALEVPQSEADRALRHGSEPGGAEALGRPPDQVVEEFQRETVAPGDQRPDMAAYQWLDQIAPMALAAAERAVLAGHPRPDLARDLAGNLVQRGGELGI